MATREVELEFKVDSDRSVRDLERLGNSANSTGTRLQGMGKTGGAGAAALGARMAAMAGPIGMAAAAVAGASVAFVKWSGHVEEVNGVLNRMQGSVSLAQEQIGGMISRIDLATARNRMLQGGLQLTDQAFADVAEVASDYAAATGQDAADSTGRLGEALTTLSAEQLRQFGVSVDTSQTRAQQLESALSQLHGRAEEMETGADTLGGSFDRMGVIMSDATTAAAQASAVVAENMMSAFSDLFTEINGGEEVLISWNGVAETVIDVATTVVNWIGASVSTLADMARVTVHNFRETVSIVQQIMDQITSGSFDFSNIQHDMLPPHDAIQAFRDHLAENEREVSEHQERVTEVEHSGHTTRAAQASTARQTESLTLEQWQALQLGNLARFNTEMAMADRAHRDAVTAARLDALAVQLQAEREAKAASDELNFQQAMTRRNTQAELVEGAYEAAVEFRNAWVTSIDEVIGAWGRMTEAQQRAGQATTDVGALMRASAAATGKEIVDMMGGKVVAAFGSAVSAVVKGEKTVGEAMEGMLKSILEAIAQESLVRGLMEIGKAIAEFASLNVAGGAAHLAAAAAFAAVGVAAGIGAGAMNSAQAQASAGSSGASAANSPASSAEAPRGGDIVIHYNGNPFATRDEMRRDFSDMLREAQAA